MPTSFNRPTHEHSDGRIVTYRSGWEGNYALYLDWLKVKEEIYDWEYEPSPRYEFIVTEGNRQRVLSLGYLPDFKVWKTKEDFYLVELKGRLQGMLKLKRMKKFYPDVKIELVQAKEYFELRKKVGRMLNWD